MANKLWSSERTAFQTAIKQVRVQAGLTQVQLAEALSKPQSYVSKYESGERKLEYVEVVEICRCCRIGMVEFFSLYEDSVSTDVENK